MTSGTDGTDELPTALILYDGVCGLCDRTVTFIIDHDRAAYFRFAKLQSSLATRILPLSQQAYFPGDLSTVVLIESGKLYLRSTAALRIMRHLSLPLPLLAWLIVLPSPLRDGVYDWIARHRYRWFGKLEACRLPDAATEGRFLLAYPTQNPRENRKA